MLASALVIGLAIGIAATVFGYSNLSTVDVNWSIFHVDGVPLWTVAVVPLALVLIAGTIYHWMDGLHHFSEHMRHRRRVHELEAEVASLRAHLDRVLEMPDQSSSSVQTRPVAAEPLPVRETEAAALPEPSGHDASAPANGTRAVERKKRAALVVAAEAPAATPAPLATNGGREAASTESGTAS